LLTVDSSEPPVPAPLDRSSGPIAARVERGEGRGREGGREEAAGCLPNRLNRPHSRVRYHTVRYRHSLRNLRVSSPPLSQLRRRRRRRRRRERIAPRSLPPSLSSSFPSSSFLIPPAAAHVLKRIHPHIWEDLLVYTQGYIDRVQPPPSAVVACNIHMCGYACGRRSGCWIWSFSHTAAGNGRRNAVGGGGEGNGK